MAVRTLACAILQVEQAIETRYLSKPLGENEKERLKRQKKLLEKKKREGSEDGELLSTNLCTHYVIFYPLESMQQQ